MPEIRRRPLLVGAAAGVSTGLVLPGAADAAPRPTPRPLPARVQRRVERIRPGWRSDNGWQVESATDVGGAIWHQDLVGTAHRLPLRIGETATILLHVLRRFHYEVEAFEHDAPVGWLGAPGPRTGPESNHRSGTAVDALPGHFPPGARGVLFSTQRRAVLDIVSECQGAVAWGGHFRHPHVSHFHIDVPPGHPKLGMLARRFDETSF